MGDVVKGELKGTDRFEVVRELGAGGMGFVYEVLDRQRNSTVTLKTLKASGGLQLFRFKHGSNRLTSNGAGTDRCRELNSLNQEQSCLCGAQEEAASAFLGDTRQR